MQKRPRGEEQEAKSRCSGAVNHKGGCGGRRSGVGWLARKREGVARKRVVTRGGGRRAGERRREEERPPCNTRNSHTTQNDPIGKPTTTKPLQLLLFQASLSTFHINVIQCNSMLVKLWQGSSVLLAVVDVFDQHMHAICTILFYRILLYKLIEW
jgi:hypothetical protein